MSQNDNFKPSLFLDSFFGDEFAEDNERFLLFLKAYYEWLQTTRIEVVNQTGTFQRDEVVIGATSKATGIIREVQDGAIVVQYTTKKVFSKSETITGQTSSATATIYSVKDNVVRASGNIVDYRTLENSIDKYFEYLRDELYTSLPVDFYGNKRLVATKFRDFFSSKSSEQSYRFLFKLLYNETVEFYYPGEDILRVSDGKYERTQVIRVTADAYGTNALGETYSRNVFDFLNKTIRGSSSGALAFVVDIKKFFIGSIETAEMTLRLVSADFEGGETITDIEDENLNATVYGIVAGFDIVDGGSGYEVGDTISITGDGAQASAIVSSIKQSPITALTVNATGHGYQLGTDATISNTGTGGSGLIVRVTDITNTYSYTDANTGTTYTLGEISEVSIINRGSGYYASPVITLQDTDIEPLGLLSEKLITIDNVGESYTVGDDLVFTGGSGANAAGIVASVTANSDFSNNLVFEDGFSLLFEQSYDDVLKTEDWDLGAIGPIRRIELTNFGDGYTTEDLPTVTVNTSTGANAEFTVTGIQGSSANVIVDTANNATGVGSIRALQIFNFGIDYTTATADATGAGDGNANLIPIISGIGVKEGTWLDDDGKIDYKILQDSFYFQDYSYVIKSGLTVQTYIDTIKKSIHPAGLQVFGELLLLDVLDVSSVWKSSVETIKDFIVRIYDFITVVPLFNEFDITLEAKIESFTALQVALIPNTDLASQEYVIQVVPGGDDTINVPYVFNEPEREIIVRVERDFNAEMEVEVAPIRKMYVSTTDIHFGYSIASPGGLGDQQIYYYAEDAISTIADEIFGSYPGSLNELGERTIFLTRGGDDLNRIENLSASMNSKLVYNLYLFWDNAPSVLISDIDIAQTGTREVVVDRITFVSAYGIQLKEIEIGDVGSLSFTDNIAESNYQGTNASFADSTFETIYRTYPYTQSEVTKILSVLKPEGQIETSGKYTVSVYAKGNRYSVYGDDVLDAYSSNTILSLSETRFEQALDIVESREINAFISPLPSGQSERQEEFSDIFRTRIKFEFKPVLDLSVRSNELLVSATTNTIELNQEIPILIQFDVAVNAVSEYTIPIESLGLANSEFTMIIAFSSVTPQKLQTSESVVLAYGLTGNNLTLDEVSGATFESYIPELGGDVTQIKDLTFSGVYRGAPRTFAEINVEYQNEEYVGIDNINREVVVEFSPGRSVRTWSETTLLEESNALLSSYEQTLLGDFYAISFTGNSIEVNPSPWINGINPIRKDSTDTVFSEYVKVVPREIDSAYTWGEILLSDWSEYQLGQTVDIGTGTIELEDISLDTRYFTIPTKTTINKYEKISGTVSSDSSEYSSIELQLFANSTIGALSSDVLTSSAPTVIGNSTDFTSDFSISDKFVANNELFTVVAVANSDFMVVDFDPSSPYSGISAYKQVN